MGADTHGEPFYKNQPKQQNTIASFEDACESVARKLRFERFAEMEPHYDDMHLVYKQAAELYAESKAREAWDRACEAQRQFCTIAFNNGFIPNQAPKPEYQP